MMFLKIFSQINKQKRIKLTTRHYANDSKPKYRLNLHRTSFPLRLNAKAREERDHSVQIKNQFVYEWQQKELPGPAFVLHDGPPYANGTPHMGHAINKILKDIICRQKILTKTKVNFIPGWDCHGLPIELKAMSTNKNRSPVEIRHLAKSFADKVVTQQMNVFKSWGVMADWNNAYKTNEKAYVKNQLKIFWQLYERGFIYRDFKPVYWSPSSRTALAESELEYNHSHKSTAVYLAVRFDSTPGIFGEFSKKPIHAVIWTTTPWTLPANQAICYNSAMTYSLIEIDDVSGYFVIATDLLDELKKKLNREFRVKLEFSGKNFEHATYFQPFDKSTKRFFHANHVSSSKGTGLVHTAPAHGPDDFVVALKNNLPLTCHVDDDGKFDASTRADLKGLPVLTDGNEKVLELLARKIIHTETFVHSYPYDWRTKQPVLLKTSRQWFFDTRIVKDKALECLNTVETYPKQTSNVNWQILHDMVNKRPYWCISRQRSWGVPIPVFYHKETGQIHINKTTIENICNLIDEHGLDAWWTLPTSKFVDDKNMEKSQDILDIWFDSGISWSSVLQTPGQIADVCLEGVDQTNGWFQSSLLTSVALRNVSPYKNLFIHGFAVDEHGRKMSKSLGNVVDPDEIVNGGKGGKAFGVDTLRWWVAAHGTPDSKVPISANILKTCAESVQRIRAIFSFLLSNVQDFPVDLNVENMDFSIIDGYMLHKLYEYNEKITKHYNEYEMNRICNVLLNFLANDVSAFYCHTVKNRLYCEPAHSSKRRAAQYVLFNILNVLNRSLAPILPHLAEEVHACVDNKSIFQSDFKLLDVYHQPDVVALMADVFDVKSEINKFSTKNSWGFEVMINADARALKSLKLFHPETTASDSQLNEILQVSRVTVMESGKLESLTEKDFTLEIVNSNRHVCNRCRRFTSDRVNELCGKCIEQECC